MDIKKILKAMSNLEDDRRVSKDIVLDSLKEALEKAYRKQIRAEEINLKVDIDEKDKVNPIKMYQLYEVVADDEDITDYELQMELDNARKYDPTIKVGDTLAVSVDINECGRAAAVLAKNVLKQKIREAEKSAIYNEYKDKVGDMVMGVIEAIEPKYMMVNLGDALALMPKAAQLPTEVYREGQSIRVVITACEKDTKGSQLLVSRADALLVKRLFERDVPEIYQGVVEIKAIAREPGERTKMAVMSHVEGVDPVGTCVGVNGIRVGEVSNEIKGERIDIFQYSDDITELVANALKPAEIITAVPNPNGQGIIVVVDESQLSLAIGRKGKNVRLVAKLTGKKVDIKTESQLLDEGIDYVALKEQYKIDLANARKAHQKEEVERLGQEAQARAAAKAASGIEDPDLVEDLMINTDTDVEEVPLEEAVVESVASVEAQKAEETTVSKEQVSETDDDKTVIETSSVSTEPMVETTETVNEKPVKHKRSLKERSDYVSVFETFADASKNTPEESKPSKKRKKKRDDDRRVSNADLVKDKEYSLKPFYTDEELAEIEAQQEAYEDYDDIDYDEYAEYYEDDAE